MGKFKELLMQIKEGTFSPAMTKVLGKPMCLKKVCDKCGFMMPKYVGRYPKFCPNCGDPVDEKDKEVQVDQTEVHGDTGLQGEIGGNADTVTEANFKTEKTTLKKIRKLQKAGKKIVADYYSDKKGFQMWQDLDTGKWYVTDGPPIEEAVEIKIGGIKKLSDEDLLTLYQYLAQELNKRFGPESLKLDPRDSSKLKSLLGRDDPVAQAMEDWEELVNNLKKVSRWTKKNNVFMTPSFQIDDQGDYLIYKTKAGRKMSVPLYVETDDIITYIKKDLLNDIKKMYVDVKKHKGIWWDTYKDSI